MKRILNASTPGMIYHGTMREFEDIVNLNKLLLYSVVYGIAGNLEADDIVQEAFIYAYYHYGTLKDQNKLSSWLCAIARNKTYDSIKKNSRTVSMDILGEALSYATPESLIIRHEEKSRLMTEIASLSDKYRETVMLHYFAGKSIREISDILSVPEGTIKFRLSESRKKLKKELIDMMSEEKNSIEQKDIFIKIKEQTEKANKAIKENDTKTASDICDAMLREIGNLSTLSLEELSTLDSLYHAKIRAIRHVEGVKAVDKYLKKTVEIAEVSGNIEWMSGAYSYYAGELSNMGHVEDSAKYYQMALDKAEESGKERDIADRLYWCGISAYQRKEADFGLSYFERVLSMKEKLFTDNGNECMNKNTYTLAYSAVVAIKHAGDRIGKLKGFDSTAPSIARADTGYSLAGQPGFGGDDGSGCCEDIFYYITRMAPCLSNKLKECYIFEQNTFSYSHNPIRSRFEVISMNETYEAPVGKFKSCLHTRYTNFVADDGNELNKRTNGVTDIWYAPNIGIAGIIIAPIAASRKCLKLSSYQVESTANAKLPELYLPLATGNKWSYEAFDPNDVPLSENYEYENLFEVVCDREYDNAAVIAHSAWSCKKE
ncbi:MAG: RNA polymerase sigma factor [Eubacteriales bacterium]